MPAAIRVKLSAYQIAQLAGQPEIREVVDLGCPGLLLRFHRLRSRGSWYVQWYEQGVRRVRVFARWPTHSLEQARAQAPAELDRWAGRQAPPPLGEFVTVGEVLGWYAERLAKARAVSADRRHATASVITRRLLPFLDAMPISELSAKRLDDDWWQRVQGDYSPGSLSAALKILKRAFALALEQGRLAQNPLQPITLATFGAPVIRPKPGRLKPYQVGGVIAAICGPLSAGAMLAAMLLLHGTRLGETRKSRWDHFDLSGGVWHVPAAITKSGRAYDIPLTPTALGWLAAWRQNQETDGYRGPWLWPDGAGHGIPAREATRAISRVSAGDWSAHDLRKLFRSRLDEQGTPYTLAESLVNHALGKLDQTYILTADALAAKRTALETYHAWLIGNGLTI